MKAVPQFHKHPVVTLRVGDDDFEYGMPYRHHLSLVLSDPPEVIGLTEAPTPAIREAVKRACRELGYAEVLVRRIDPATRRERRHLYKVAP